MPLAFLPYSAEISKEALEKLHLQKFATDFCLATSKRPYRNVATGTNPPDFFVETDTGENSNVDCVQFAAQSRRQAYALFDKIRQIISEQEPSKFDHLRGLLVFVYVENLSLPLRREQKDSLIEELLKFHFTAEMGVSIGIGMPMEAPNIGGVDVQNGWKFHASPFIASAPTSPFFLQMGFDLAFVYPTEHLVNETWDEFNRLIQKHDKQKINELLITVGGPDRYGNIHPSEKAILDFILQYDRSLNYQFAYLKRIFVHEWATGKIIKLYPEVQIISPGNFADLTPAHQPLAPRG